MNNKPQARARRLKDAVTGGERQKRKSHLRDFEVAGAAPGGGLSSRTMPLVRAMSSSNSCTLFELCCDRSRSRSRSSSRSRSYALRCPSNLSAPPFPWRCRCRSPGAGSDTEQGRRRGCPVMCPLACAAGEQRRRSSARSATLLNMTLISCRRGTVSKIKKAEFEKIKKSPKGSEPKIGALG